MKRSTDTSLDRQPSDPTAATPTAATPTAGPTGIDLERKASLAGGIFYLLTFVSMPTLAFYSPVQSGSDFVLGAGSAVGVRVGALSEVIVGLACLGTAVALYPVVKRQSQALALGFVTTRTLEASMIFLGVVSMLTLVTLREDLGAPGADGVALATTGSTLVAVYEFAFLVGQTLMPGFNAVLLGTLMYRSGLVPRVIPLMGLVGAPVHIAVTFATILGVNERMSVWALVGTLPIALWELSLGVWLVVKGFRPSPILATPAVAR